MTRGGEKNCRSLFRKFLCVLVTLAILFAHLSCTPRTPEKELTVKPELPTFGLPDEDSPSPGDEPFRAVTEPNLRFAFDLYRILSENVDGNLCFSPYAVSSSLGIVYSGADGETSDVIAKTLNFPSSDKCNIAFSDLRSMFDARGMVRGESVEEGIQVELRQSLWFSTDMDVSAEYLDEVGMSYGIQASWLDPDVSIDEHFTGFASWLGVDDPSFTQIVDLPNPNGFMLTARVDFSGYWLQLFELWEDQGEFHLEDGEIRNIPMMGRYGKIEYARGDAYSIVQLNYSNKLNSIILVIPDEGCFHDVESFIDEVTAVEALGKLQPENILIDMPIVNIKCTLNLSEALMTLGIPGIAMDESPGYGRITVSNDPARIESFIVSTDITIDERSSKAHPAQAVRRIQDDDEEEGILMINRPFIFLVRDIPTDTILIMGRVMDPGMENVVASPNTVIPAPINTDS